MNSQTQLILDVWEVYRDLLPINKRVDAAEDMLAAFVEYGFEPEDISTIVDEDPVLHDAFYEIFPDSEDDADDIEQDTSDE